MFSKLAGLSTRICQTVHKGALAFLVVASSIDKAAEKSVITPKNASKKR
jgi:ribosomal protein S20